MSANVNESSQNRGEPAAMSKSVERRGKSWKREREERGRRQQQLQNQSDSVVPPETNNISDPPETTVENSQETYNQAGGDAEVLIVSIHESSKESTPSDEASTAHAEQDANLQQPPPEMVEENNIEEEEKKFLEKHIAEANERLAIRGELRIKNLHASSNRPEEGFFSKLDSNLKKNTAFVKRLKNFTEAQRDSLLRDMQCLNLTKYIGEAAAAIVEAKLKMSDVNCGVQICSELHQRYSEFAPMLLENWQKMLSVKKDEKISNPSKLRVDLRFYAELISVGVFTNKEGLPLLGNLLTTLTTMDKEEHNNLNIILSFCKHCGEDYAGLVPRKLRLLSEKFETEVPKSMLLNAERQKNVRVLLRDYYHSLCKHLLKDHKDIQSMDRQNRRILQTKGELNTDRREKYEQALISYQKLLVSTQQFADLLDENLPALPQDDVTKDECEIGTLDIHNRFKNSEFQFDGDTSLWEDEDTRIFYENLPDLKAFIPGILFKDSAQSAPSSAEAVEPEKEEEELEDVEQPDEDIEIPIEEEEKKESSEEILPPEIEDEPEEPETTTSAANKILLESFLTNIPNCVNRELIDKAAVDFCMNLNTKPNRRKLVKALFLVPRTRLDLLPFYSRLVATLHPCMPDVATDLVAMLKQDLKYHVKKKDQINIESKVKIVRFIGELVKFKMFPKTEALYCLKLLLFDFTHHHIEMACNLLETCGRFLFRSADSHHRTKVYLEQMMRKKSVRALDSRYVTMIENAYYYCNPPEALQAVKKERPPMHEYIRKVLYKELSKNNIEKILRQFRKFNWEDSDTAFYATKCLTAVWNVKYYNIRCVANLLAGLVSHQENIGPQVVDGILEDIRLGMEVNHPKFNQRRVSAVRYLGELYNYRMVESSVIFKTLYSFITFGVNLDGSYSDLDPPDSLFRLRLTCILLETCGQYFNSGSSKKKLDCFITYFQRYFWFKKSLTVWNEDNPFPITQEFLFRDMLTLLRPKLKAFEGLEEAQKAVDDLEKEIYAKLLEIMPSLKKKNLEDGQYQTSEDGLETIRETNEDAGEEQQGGGDDDDRTSDDSETDADGDGDDDVEVTGESQSQPMDHDGLHGDDMDMEDGAESGDDNHPHHLLHHGPSLESDEVKLINAQPKLIQCQEDEDFMTAFDKMLSENIQHRSQEVVKPPQVDISVPMHIKVNPKKPQLGMMSIFVPSQEPIQEEQQPQPDKNNTINFILMMRKGGKQQYKNLEVSVTSELAQNLRDKEEAERAEKERVKRLTLDISERQEEEDYQEMLAAQQRPAVMNLNRERRQKYQHPKGVPDADVIFGNKWETMK